MSVSLFYPFNCLKKVSTFTCLLGFLINTHVNAQVCSAVFPDVAGAHTSGGSLEFSTNARLYDTDGIINVSTIINGHASDCNTQSCVSSGNASVSLSLPSFNYTDSSQNINAPQDSNYFIAQGSYDDITVGRNVTLDISQNNQVTRLSSLVTDNNVTLRLSSGEYWIDTLTMGENSNIEVVDGENVVIYVNSASFGQNIQLNNGGNEDALVIIAYANFTISKNSKMRGYLYVQGNLVFGENNDFYGAFSATNTTLGSNGKYYTRVSGLETANFNGACEQNINLPNPIAYYPMDMCTLPSSSNSIKDEIAGSHGDTEGNVDINYAGKYCQAAVLDGGQSYINLPDPASSDLSEGTISFYFNAPDFTHSSAPSAGSMTLISRDASGTESGGHLTIWVTDSGAISVNHQSATQSHISLTASNIVNQNQWHHVVYTWGSDGQHIYIDGILENTPTSYTGGLSANGVKMAVGANAWNYNSSLSTARVAQLKDFFKGSIDEIRIFDQQLVVTQVRALQQIAVQSCISCSNDPVLVANWGADVCSFQENEIRETVSGIHAIARNGISNEFSSRFCQGLAFTGNASYATVDHDSRLQISDGAISMWVKLPDLNHSNASFATGMGLLSKDVAGFGDGGHIEISVNATGHITVTHQNSIESKELRSISPVMLENQWHHLVYSFGALGSYVYVDGQEVVSDADYQNGLSNNTETLVFGATSRRAIAGNTGSSNFDDFLLGELDHIKVYRNQPSAQDIGEWFNELAQTCTTCSSLIAEYTFDQTNADSLAVKDSSGNNNNGTLDSPLSSVLLSDNIACRAFESDNNTNASRVAFDTGVDANTLGSQGSITFWYQSNTDWNDGTARKLVDATQLDSGATSNSKYFFVTKTGDGRISFGLEDSNDDEIITKTSSNTFAANEWVHIAVQWNMVTREFRIFINAQEKTFSSYYESQLGSLGALSSIVFGDNKENYTVFDSTNNAANGYFDEIRMYSQAVSQSQVLQDMEAAEPCAGVHHYLIEHPATALSCDTPEITVKACSDSDCTSVSNLPSSITLNPDMFSPSSSLSFTGQTTVRLNSQPAGVVVLSSTQQDPVAPVLCTNNCEIEFVTAGLQFFNRSTNETHFNHTHFVAEAAFDRIGLRMLDDSSGSCEGFSNEQRDITFTYECVNTVSDDYTPSQCNVPFASIPLSGGQQQSGTLNLSFDTNGETNLGAYSFADAGILRLTASLTLNGVALQAATTELKIVPESLLLAASASAINVAGEAFSVNIAGVGALGSVLPGFQANELAMSAQRISPVQAGAIDAEMHYDANNKVTTAFIQSFGNIAANFVNGMAQSSTALMEEVGTYRLSMQDRSYLGRKITSNTLELGRFTPAYFNVTKVHQPLLENTHDSFTYVGQTFAYQQALTPQLMITAYNAQGQVSANYSNEHWKLSPNITNVQDQVTISDVSVYSGMLNRERAPTQLNITGNDVFDGKGTYDIVGGEFSYTKIAAPTGADTSPFSGSFNITYAAAWFTDADNICYQSNYPSGCEGVSINAIDGVNLRYGRLRINNAFGPETDALAVPIFVEYLDQSQWRRNTLDNHTTLALAQSSGHISVSHDVQSPVDLTGALSPLTVNSVMLNGILPTDALSIAPLMLDGEPLSGSFDIQLIPNDDSHHWSHHLNYDWDGDGDIDNDDEPEANVNLGIYRGNERTLHWREVLN